MTGNIHSSDFYKQIAMSKADINKNGQIDEAEYELNGRKINEKSIFEEELKKFDMNQDGVVDDKDVPMFKNKVEFTEEEKQAKKEMAEFMKQNPDIDAKTASAEDSKKFLDLYKKVNYEKQFDECYFREDIGNVIKYMEDIGSNDLDNYWHSISKRTGIDNNVSPEKVKDVKKHMDGLTFLVGNMSESSSKSTEADKTKYANALATDVINTADMATDNLYIQSKALSNLNVLSHMGVDNKEIIEDVKNNLRNIKSNYEQELQNTKDANDKQLIQKRIADIDKLLK